MPKKKKIRYHSDKHNFDLTTKHYFQKSNLVIMGPIALSGLNIITER